VKKETLLSASIILALLFSAVTGAYFVKSTRANPYLRRFDYEKVLPPAGAKPPIILIDTPQNGSFYPKSFNLTFDAIILETNGDKSISSITELYYIGSWDPYKVPITPIPFGHNTSYTIDLYRIPGGNHSLTIYAKGYGSYEVDQEFEEPFIIRYYMAEFEMTGYSTISFTKDLVSPRISFLSPQNVTYVTSDFELDFTVSEATSEVLYCLDGKANQTVTGSLAFTGLENGVHNVTLYAADLAGNVGDPETLFFSVDVSEPFPVVPVTTAFATVAIILVSAGLLVYFRKRKH
jgi:hypothetical protein